MVISLSSLHISILILMQVSILVGYCIWQQEVKFTIFFEMNTELVSLNQTLVIGRYFFLRLGRPQAI